MNRYLVIDDKSIPIIADYSSAIAILNCINHVLFEFDEGTIDLTIWTVEELNTIYEKLQFDVNNYIKQYVLTNE